MAEMQVVEAGRRLSECLLWRLQEEFYANAGLNAWENTREAVPFYPTSNALIGELYATLILNFMLDCADAGLLDFSAPFYVLELATGSGAFSFYLLKELRRRMACFERLAPLQLRYVMTDFADTIVGDWTKNDRLQPFLEEDVLDFAVFRPEEQSSLQCLRSGAQLAPGALKNPVAAVANYFFDSIRQDQFRVLNHQLHETRLTFTRALDDIAPDSPVRLAQLVKTEQDAPVSTDYYPSERLNRILRDYAAEFEQASILFPVGAFRCIDNLLALGGNRLLLLAADKGFTRADYLSGIKEQQYTPHQGAFSYMVNFDALSRYFHLHQGYALTDPGDTSILNMLAGGVLEGVSPSLERLRHCFAETVVKKDAANAVNLARRLLHPERYDALGLLRGAVALIQLSNFDPLMLCECQERILAGIGESLFVTDFRALMSLLARVRGNVYAVDPSANAYHALEKIYFRLGRMTECQEVARESIARMGPTAHSLIHLAACFENTGQPAEALTHYRQAASLDPDAPAVQAALERLSAQASR